MTQTKSRYLLDSTREDAQLVLFWANQCAQKGGSFSVNNIFDKNWFTEVIINWPEGVRPGVDLKGES